MGNQHFGDRSYQLSKFDVLSYGSPREFNIPFYGGPSVSYSKAQSKSYNGAGFSKYSGPSASKERFNHFPHQPYHKNPSSPPVCEYSD